MHHLLKRKVCIMEDVHLLLCAHIFSFCGVLNLDILSHPKCLGVSGLCSLKLHEFTFLYNQTLHSDCSHIEDVWNLDFNTSSPHLV